MDYRVGWRLGDSTGFGEWLTHSQFQKTKSLVGQLQLIYGKHTHWIECSQEGDK